MKKLFLLLFLFLPALCYSEYSTVAQQGKVVSTNTKTYMQTRTINIITLTNHAILEDQYMLGATIDYNAAFDFNIMNIQTYHFVGEAFKQNKVALKFGVGTDFGENYQFTVGVGSAYIIRFNEMVAGLGFTIDYSILRNGASSYSISILGLYRNFLFSIGGGIMHYTGHIDPLYRDVEPQFNIGIGIVQ